MKKVLAVTEKPKLATSIAAILSDGNFETRRGKCPVTPVHEFVGMFKGEKVLFKMTSVVGHVYKTELKNRVSWSTDPVLIFDEELTKLESDPKIRLVSHLKHEAKGVDFLVLFLDCDREGENICFEVMDNCLPKMNRRNGQTVFRAKFSAITKPDITKAMNTLGQPNENESRSVDARQEIDFRVGIIFSRFQTNYFAEKYANLESDKVTYGPCQIPTLGFCVERYNEIVQFQPEKFWKVDPYVMLNARKMKLRWNRGRIFNQPVASLFHSIIDSLPDIRVSKISHKVKKKTKPAPLNTVNLMKIASKNLGIGPHQAMHLAEQLYLDGYITYPRTETTKYPTNFDFRGVLESHGHNPHLSNIINPLLREGLNIPKGGHDAGDHPPITPTGSVYTDQSGDKWRIYDYIFRHFVATLSKNCKYKEITVEFEGGDESFSCTGIQVTQHGFTDVMYWLRVEDINLDSVEVGQRYEIVNVELNEKETKPPRYLSESDLIGLMERYGIGTDASISTHINTICKRNYVVVDNRSRELEPTYLGIALIGGFKKIDPELVGPRVRGVIEQYINYIAEGKATYEEVVDHCIEIFRQKYLYFVENITKMDELFEMSFSTFTEIEVNNKVRPHCGKCDRFMKLIGTKNSKRLFCTVCQDTYKLPSKGRIRCHRNKPRCPICNFELLTHTDKLGTAKMVCPMCTNEPPFEGMTQGMLCDQCTSQECKYALQNRELENCPQCDVGKLVVPAQGAVIYCNLCLYKIIGPDHTTQIKPCSGKCEDCGTAFVTLVSDREIFFGDKTLQFVCIECHPIRDHFRIKSKDTVGRGGGGRGRGRGKKRGGKRGGRRGRGRR